MIDRRRLLVVLGTSILGFPARTFGQSPKVPRVGILASGSAPTFARSRSAFEEGMRSLGYVDGQTVAFITRLADGQFDRLPALAAELVAEKVDVILASGTVTAKAAHEATSSIPIVFATVSDPVGSGFVQSLARPGFNMTGTSIINEDLAAKRLEILKEMQPRTTRVAVLVSDEPNVPGQVEQIRKGAKLLGIVLTTAKVQRREDFDSVNKQLGAWRTDAILVTENTANSLNSRLLAEFAAHVRLPAMYAHDRYPRDGGLVSYGPNQAAMFRRAAYFVDKILKGAKPADLPVELPTHFELVINMKAARALGIKVPQALLLRVDKVIE